MRDLNPDLLRRMEAYARETGRALEAVTKRFAEASGEQWGFLLLVFSFEGRELTYISNADRADMVKTLRELAHKMESGEVLTSDQKN